jgi:hypothetical protein
MTFQQLIEHLNSSGGVVDGRGERLRGDIDNDPNRASRGRRLRCPTRALKKAVGEAEGKRVDALEWVLAQPRQAMFGAGGTARPSDARRNDGR